MVQNVVLVFLRRRLSQRPNVEELESRNILKRKFRKYPKNVSSCCSVYDFSLNLKKKKSNGFAHLQARTVKRGQSGALVRAEDSSCTLFSSRTHECTFFHLSGKHDFLCTFIS